MPCSLRDGGGCFCFLIQCSLLKLGGVVCVPCHSAHAEVGKKFWAFCSVLVPCSEAGISLASVTALRSPGVSHACTHVQLFAWVQGLNSKCLHQPRHLPGLWFFLWLDFSGRKSSVATQFPCLFLMSSSDRSQMVIVVVVTFQVPSPSTLPFLCDPLSFVSSVYFSSSSLLRLVFIQIYKTKGR